jgi:DNA-binding SARP family transcriptional activator
MDNGVNRATPELEFRVLGPVEAVRNETRLALGGPRPRALLALLLLEPGRAVPADRLTEELWQGKLPSGRSTLPSYVSRLRAVLGDETPITSSASSYALEVSPEQVDLARFERLVGEGQDALVRDASTRAAERFEKALSLWRGRPFGDLANEGMLRQEAERLEELRVAALEGRIQAELQLGKSAELVEELEALVQEHPYRERLWAQLMLALYRSGRQAYALAAYHRARAILDEQLGLEPSEELRQLEQAILRQEVPEARPPEERHNLPAPLTSFVGRKVELEELQQLLSEARLVTLTGVGGTGKTRLALEAARRALVDFPDGVYFADLAPVGEQALVARQVAEVLDVREQGDVPLEQLIAERLREQETLLLLDNCEHLREVCAELGRRLLATCPKLRILATSRELLGAPGEVDYPVPPLALPSADAPMDEVRTSEAVELFLVRAREARRHLQEDEATSQPPPASPATWRRSRWRSNWRPHGRRRSLSPRSLRASTTASASSSPGGD